jgi:sugar lactone lactonase YvrE
MQKFTLLFLSLLTFVFAILLVPISARAGVRVLYDTDTSNGSINKFPNLDGGAITFASGLGRPEGLAFDGSGNLFVADNQAGTIFKFTPNGTKSPFNSTVSSPFSLAIDGNNNLFVSQLDFSTGNTQSGMIFKITSTGTKTTFASGLTIPTALAVDSSNNLFVADFAVATIFKFAPDGTKSTFTQQNFPIGGMAFDSLGNLFVADSQNGIIFKFTSGGTKSTFASGLNQPGALAFDGLGNLFVTACCNAILVFNPDGTMGSFTGGGAPAFLAFGPAPPPPADLRQLLNISTRGRAGTGDEALIGGFIVTTSGQPKGAVVVRAIGPSLTARGVAGALQDPMLELRDSTGALVASNDNWKDTQQGPIQATGLAPTDDRESAILMPLGAGAYTAIVQGVDDTTGVALVEVYNVQ